MRLSDRLLCWNPLLGRYAFAQLRPASLSISVGIYATTALLIFALTFASHLGLNGVQWGGFWRASFIAFCVVQILLLWIMGMHHAGSAIRHEIVEKSLDFFRLLPITAAARIAGVLIGRNLVSLGLALVNTLVLAICGSAAGVSPRLILDFAVFSWVAGAAAMLASLLAATYERREKTATGSAAFVLLGAFLLPYVLSMAAGWDAMFPHGAYVHFFAWRARLFVFLALLAIYAGGWFVLGLNRRLCNERAPLFSPVGAVLCAVGGYGVALGIAWKYAPVEPAATLLVVWSGTAVAMLSIALGSLRTWDDYLETWRRASVGPGFGAANPSNLLVGGMLVLSWFVFAFLAYVWTGIAIPPRGILVLGSFAFVLVALMETSVVYSAITTRVRLLVGFATLLYMIVPLIAAVVVGSRGDGKTATDWIAFSPVGYLICLGREAADVARSPLAPAGVNLILFLAMAGASLTRYRVPALDDDGATTRGPGASS